MIITIIKFKLEQSSLGIQEFSVHMYLKKKRIKVIC